MQGITTGGALKGVGVRLKPDTLDEENAKFEQRSLRQALFLNSVPKCGSHLLRNIVRMFVPVEQHYTTQFVQHQILDQHLSAFSDPRNLLSWGHLMFTDRTAVAVGRTRQILLVRDPYDWVTARARFFLSDEFGGFDILKEGTLTIDSLLNMMIFGVMEKAPPLAATFVYNAVAWLGTGAYLVRYEDLVAAVKDVDSASADTFFAGLFEACGIERPDDWRDRVRIGSDRKQSGTARENLTGVSVEFPSELPDLQKKMVDMVAPGMRELLGYS
ncbi:MAG: hypothetical protein JOZ20_01680 [Sphingomonas sp.]|nr:hypothetical protein [Sphingomonas sp.]MBW0007487.1 hypothetical protein [Sphingomonas sp.]